MQITQVALGSPIAQVHVAEQRHVWARIQATACLAPCPSPIRLSNLPFQ